MWELLSLVKDGIGRKLSPRQAGSKDSAEGR